MSYRKTIWYLKALNEFTQGGFNSAKKRFDLHDLDVDCKGKVYLITGANSGIGKQAALEMARRGGAVHMVCRNPTAAQEAREEIVKESDNNDIHVHIVDMSEPKSVHKFAKEFKEKQKTLNCLVNNAGCMLNNKEVTADGLEKNFATNTLGTFILTEELLPLLNASSDPRVIVVSSGGMLLQKLDLSDLQSEKGTFEGTAVYAQQKRQQVVMTAKWAQRVKDVFFASMHPGWADTPALANSMTDFYEKHKSSLRTPAEGADTIVWLALAKVARNNNQSGLFYLDRQAVSQHLPLAWTKSDEGDEDKLMQILTEMSRSFQ